jgi:hypothetical protein
MIEKREKQLRLRKKLPMAETEFFRTEDNSLTLHD